MTKPLLDRLTLSQRRALDVALQRHPAPVYPSNTNDEATGAIHAGSAGKLQELGLVEYKYDGRYFSAAYVLLTEDGLRLAQAYRRSMTVEPGR